MEFRKRTLMQIADMICGKFGDVNTFLRYRTGSMRHGVFSGLQHPLQARWLDAKPLGCRYSSANP